MNEMDLHEQIKDIKTQLRQSMNGVVSQSMRERGLTYKLNFGVELPRIKMIASGLEQNHDLAQALWKEDIRECKILATMLQPVETFYPEIADIWVESIPTMELAEIATMNLFIRLPYASEKAFQWISMDTEFFPVCGFLLLARIFMSGALLNERSENEFLDQVAAALGQDEDRVQRAALTSALKYIHQNPAENGKKLLKLISSFRQSDSKSLQAIYEEIKTESTDFA